MNDTQIKKTDKSRIISTYKRSDVVLESGEGSVCFSKDGKRYIDFTAGIGVNSLGFCDKGWINAVTEQLNKLQHSSNLFYTEPQVKVADMLTKATGLEKIFFANSGAESNETAVKIARKYGKTRKGSNSYHIISLMNSFHGRTMAAIAATGQHEHRKFFLPVPPGFEYCEPDNRDMLEKLVCDETCGIIVEIIQGEGGVLPLDSKFLKAAEKICRQQDVLFIVDEVQTGIGRTGKLFAYEHYGLEPDMVTFAKGIGGGLPMGGVLVSKKCCDVLKPGDHGTTYGGNPVACAGAVEVLSRMNEVFLNDVRKKGMYMRSELLKLDAVRSVTGIGMIIGVKFESIDVTRLMEKAAEKGLLVLTAKDKLRLLPPLTIAYEQIDEGIEILKNVLMTMTE